MRCVFDTNAIISAMLSKTPSGLGYGGLDRARARVVGHRRGRIAGGAVLVRSAEPGGEVDGHGGEAGGRRRVTVVDSIAALDGAVKPGKRLDRPPAAPSSAVPRPNDCTQYQSHPAIRTPDAHSNRSLTIPQGPACGSQDHLAHPSQPGNPGDAQGQRCDTAVERERLVAAHSAMCLPLNPAQLGTKMVPSCSRSSSRTDRSGTWPFGRPCTTCSWPRP